MSKRGKVKKITVGKCFCYLDYRKNNLIHFSKHCLKRRNCFVCKNTLNIRVWLSSYKGTVQPFPAYRRQLTHVQRTALEYIVTRGEIAYRDPFLHTGLTIYFSLDVRQNCSLSFICRMLFKMCAEGGKSKRIPVVKRLNIKNN